MHMTRTNGKRLSSEEEAFRHFTERFDHEIYYLELEYNERLGEAIRGAVRTRLDRKQARFDQFMAAHPATLAENERRAEMRRLERNRHDQIALRMEVREKQQLQSGIARLAHRWRAKLIKK